MRFSFSSLCLLLSFFRHVRRQTFPACPYILLKMWQPFCDTSLSPKDTSLSPKDTGLGPAKTGLIAARLLRAEMRKACAGPDTRGAPLFFCGKPVDTTTKNKNTATSTGAETPASFPGRSSLQPDSSTFFSSCKVWYRSQCFTSLHCFSLD